MYRVDFASPVRKDLKILSDDVKSELPKHIEALKANPRQGEPFKKLLKGIWKYEFTYKRTSYRIAYRILEEEKVILIEMIGSRENFYERLKRRLK